MSFFFFFFKKNEHKTIFFFNIYLKKNNSWPRVIIHVSIWTRVVIHVSNWTRVLNTRVYLDACILYTCPIGVFIQLATLSKRHVANWTRVCSNRYCRYASNCRVFCSDIWVRHISCSHICTQVGIAFMLPHFRVRHVWLCPMQCVFVIV
jgi:hypothetical protein